MERLLAYSHVAAGLPVEGQGTSLLVSAWIHFKSSGHMPKSLGPEHVLGLHYTPVRRFPFVDLNSLGGGRDAGPFLGRFGKP